MTIEEIAKSAAGLRAVLFQAEVAAMTADLAALLRRPEPIDVEALREAGLQMVFKRNGQIVFQEREG